MAKSNPPRGDGASLVLAMLAMVAIPAAAALRTVHAAPRAPMADPGAAPHGYTWSLLLFVVPITVIAFWLLPNEGVRLPKRAFWRTIGVLVPAGCGMEFFFAPRFFVFPNPGATLGIGAPAWGGSVPVEEYVFYLTGFLAVLLIYIWLSEYWLASYGVADYPAESAKVGRLLVFHPASAILGIVLVGGAVLYRKVFSDRPEGFPSYFTVLVSLAFVPSAGFFPSARPFINWRAFSLTLFLILLVSLLWEATLAIPYGWWGYQPRQMMGLFIRAWGGLPIEAVALWVAVTYATVVVFEVAKLWQASGKKVRQAFFGMK